MNDFSIAADELYLSFGEQGDSTWRLSKPLPGESNQYDIQLLGLTPLSSDQSSPDAPGLRYRRTARPGQGTLSNRPTAGLMITLLDAVAAGDSVAAQSLRDWADFVHIPPLAASGTPGLTMISPYGVVGDGPLFMHLLEFDSDPDEAYREMTKRVSRQLDKSCLDEFLNHAQKLRVFGATFVPA
jgi:hypothetical protein